jgi:hypothetical protein
MRRNKTREGRWAGIYKDMHDIGLPTETWRDGQQHMDTRVQHDYLEVADSTEDGNERHIPTHTLGLAAWGGVVLGRQEGRRTGGQEG